jgi:general secretion pathway protein J
LRLSAENGFTPLRRSAENGFTPLRRSAENGFTLVELMVALFIFAMLAAAGVALLSFGVRAQGAAITGLDEIAKVRRMSVLIESDLAQAVPRVARDAEGRSLRAFTGNDGTSDPLILGYVRAGRTNPDGARRPGVQRVDIVLEEGQLVRATYPTVDGTIADSRTILADKVATLTMRYRDASGDWRPRWDDALVTSMPAAVEMTIAAKGRPPLKMLWATGTGYR